MGKRTPYYNVPEKNGLKHHLKHIADLKDPIAITTSIRKAPDSTIKAICNAALNVQKGDVHLSKTQITNLKKHRVRIYKLVNRAIPLPAKRKLLTQRGGGLLASALLAIAIPALGSLFFKNR